MKIGIVDIDSIIPNLALMKISAKHKKKGDTVKLINHPEINPTLYRNEFDKVYISVVFSNNIEKTKKYAGFLKGNVEIGGYFFDKGKELSYDVEHIMPDYELYDGKVCRRCGHNIKKCRCRKGPEPSEMWYSMGFTTRGCFRKCPWCIVPKKEGMIRANTDIYEFWNPKHKHIDLLDNNPMGHKKQFEKIAKQIVKEDLTVSFHGLDARILNDRNTETLSKLRIKPEPRFAFDTMEAEDGVVRAIKLLKKHGIKRALWYVLVGFDTTWNEDMYRVKLLKKYEQRPYVMRYKTVKDSNHPLYRKYNLFSSWVNQYRFFSSMSFEKFVELTKDRSKIEYKKKYKKPLDKWI
jgi:hypothetical protein